MSYIQLKDSIREAIYSPANPKISGATLQQKLVDMVDVLGAIPNPSGQATDVLHTVNIDGKIYSIQERADYNEVQLLTLAEEIVQSSMDNNNNTMYISRTTQGNPSAYLLAINIGGYKKIRITPNAENSTYFCILNRKLAPGVYNGDTIANNYMVPCPGYVPNEGSPYRMKLLTEHSSQEGVHGPLEITLDSSARFLYIQKNFSNSHYDQTPSSVVGYIAEEEGGGDVIGAGSNVGLELHSGTILENGVPVEDADMFYTSPIPLSAGFFIRLHDPYLIKAGLMYDKDNQMVNFKDLFFSDSEGYTEWGINVVLPQYYVRLLIGPKQDSSERLDATQIVDKYVTLDDARLNRESPVNTGGFPVTLANWKLFQRRLKQLVNVVWKALEHVPRSNNYFDKGTVNRGMPYSEAAEFAKYVGQHVSFRTFLTALKNKRSVMYTEDISNTHTASAYNITYHGMSSNARSYYGTVCTGLTSYVLGLADIVPSWNTQYIDGMTEIARGVHGNPFQIKENGAWVNATRDQVFDALRTMDIIYYTGHCSFISDIICDEYGDRQLVCWAEETQPRSKITPYSKEGILARLENVTNQQSSEDNAYQGYKKWILYRYNKWADMGEDKVIYEEPETTPYIQTGFMDYAPQPLSIDPDIQLCLGDYAALAAFGNAWPQNIPFCFNIHRNKMQTLVEIYNEEDEPAAENLVYSLDVTNNITGKVYNSGYSKDDADEEDWIILDMRTTEVLPSGKYKARIMHGDTASGFARFEVIAIDDFRYESGMASFDVKGGTPHLIRQEKADGISHNTWELNSGDIVAGEKQVNPDNVATYPYLKIIVRGDYGAVAKTIQINN